MWASVTSRSPTATLSARTRSLTTSLSVESSGLRRPASPATGLRACDRAADRLEQVRHRLLGRGRQHHVAGRQALIVHAPAAMDAEVVAHHDHLGGRHAVRERALAGAGEVDPVEAEDHVGGAQGLLGLRAERGRSGRPGMQRMIGRERGAELELGDDLGVERLGERDALVPALQAARHPAHQDDRILRRLEQRRGLRHQVGRRRACRSAA